MQRRASHSATSGELSGPLRRREPGLGSGASGGEAALVLDETAALLAEARQVLVFTGAGMSTGSGIPDFRGPNGLWATLRPVDYADFMADASERARHWEMNLRKEIFWGEEMGDDRPVEKYFNVPATIAPDNWGLEIIDSGFLSRQD